MSVSLSVTGEGTRKQHIGNSDRYSQRAQRVQRCHQHHEHQWRQQDQHDLSRQVNHELPKETKRTQVRKKQNKNLSKD